MEQQGFQKIVSHALNEVEKNELQRAAEVLSTIPEMTQEDVWLMIAAHLYSGNGVSQDRLKGIAIWKSLAEKGSAPAQGLFGRVLVTGDSVDQNELEGLQWLIEAGESGYAPAWIWLHQIYRDGLPGVPKDPEAALAFLTRAAMAGDIEAMLNLAHILGTQEQSPQMQEASFNWNMKAAHAGSLRAQYNLGIAYEYGRGKPIDFGKAREHYKIAAEGGIPHAKHNYGALLFNGRGGSADELAALRWYEEAAMLEMSYSQYSLGSMHLNGDTGKVDLGKALSWFLVAQKHGYGEASALIESLCDRLTSAQISFARQAAEDMIEKITPVHLTSFT